jgi:hypothetical protein
VLGFHAHMHYVPPDPAQALHPHAGDGGRVCVLGDQREVRRRAEPGLHTPRTRRQSWSTRCAWGYRRTVASRSISPSLSAIRAKLFILSGQTQLFYSTIVNPSPVFFGGKISPPCRFFFVARQPQPQTDRSAAHPCGVCILIRLCFSGRNKHRRLCRVPLTDSQYLNIPMIRYRQYGHQTRGLHSHRAD